MASLEDETTNNSGAKICVKGIVKKQHVSDIEKYLIDKKIKFSKSFTLPILYLVSRSDENQILVKKHYLTYVKNIISLVTKYPSLLDSTKWIALKITIPIDKVHNSQIFELNTRNNLDRRLIFVSREVAKVGIPTTNLGNTLEYELLRNINSYIILLTIAKIIIPELNLSIPTTRKKLSGLSPKNNLFLADLLGKYTYFDDEIKNVEQKDSIYSSANSVFTSVYKGKLRYLNENSEEDKNNDTWIYHQLNQVEILRVKTCPLI